MSSHENIVFSLYKREMDMSWRQRQASFFSPCESHTSSTVSRAVLNSQLTPRSFLAKVTSNNSFLKRLTLVKNSASHNGCVNTVNWSETGRFLVSGSDDTQICVHDYNNNLKINFKFDSGHSANIFSTKFLPNMDNNIIASCAGDRQVRVFDVAHQHSTVSPQGKLRGRTASIEPLHVFECHNARVKKLSTNPHCPHVFYSASEDATVRFFDIRANHTCRPHCDNVLIDFCRGESVELCTISVRFPYLAVAGSDPIVRVYDQRKLPTSNSSSTSEAQTVRRFAPPHLLRSTGPNSSFSLTGQVTSVAFSPSGRELVASYMGDNVYLFDMQTTREAGRDGEGLRKRKQKSSSSSSSSSSLLPSSTPMSLSSNTIESTNGNEDQAASNLEEDEGENEGEESYSGPPTSDYQASPFYASYYTGHVNLRTVKEVNFFGPDGCHVVSGSDDGNIFIWDKYTRKIINILEGDQHVVNCVQGHPFDCALATSGIENNVKLWKPVSKAREDGEEESDEVDQNLLDLRIHSIVKANQRRTLERARTSFMPFSIFSALVRNAIQQSHRSALVRRQNQQNSVGDDSEEEEEENAESDAEQGQEMTNDDMDEQIDNNCHAQ